MCGRDPTWSRTRLTESAWERIVGEVCKVIQAVGYGVALFWGLVDGLICGIGIAAVVAFGHPVMSRLSMALIANHLRLMSVADQKSLAMRAQEMGLHAAPVAWRAISRGCAAGYALLCLAAVWYFVND